MSDAADDFLVEAFFDSRTLIAVRFSAVGVPAASPALTLEGATFDSWTRNRGHDAAPPKARWANTLVVVAVGGILVSIVVGVVNSVRDDRANIAAREAAVRVVPTVQSPSETDVDGSTGWQAGALTLSEDLLPSVPDLRPYAVRILTDVPADAGFKGRVDGSWIRPSVAPADRQAYDRGVTLAESLKGLGASRDLAVILDLPGPQSVAAAAGLADFAPVVMTMDNIPHLRGVVSSHETLGALLYWRPRLMKRPAEPDRPVVFVLEGARLAPYANQQDVFDNRSTARLPSVEAFAKLGVKKVLYVRPEAGKTVEQDDLVDLFVGLEKAGVDVRHLGFTTIGSPPPESYVAAEAVASQPASQPSSRRSTSTYRSGLPYWWLYRYGWFGGARSGWTDPDASYRATQRGTTIGGRTFDGGASQRTSVMSGLGPRSATSTGGTWGRGGSGVGS